MKTKRKDREETTWRCLMCGGVLCWDNTVMASDLYSDMYLEDDNATVDFLHCMQCGRSYEISSPTKEERETDYKKHWKG